MNRKVITAVALAGATVAAGIALAASNQVRQTVRGDLRCVVSNGTPTHAIGTFPNRGNPHSFRAQEVRFCVDATPADTGRITQGVQTSGVSVTGIPFRPGTADWYDARSPRGHSRDRASGWNLEGMGSAETLGMDAQNAHVDERGLYHYHGVSPALVSATPSTQIGWAADGFPILYVGAAVRSAWMLKPGTRATAPGGRHDGTYEQDWQYVSGAGDLDRCNGALTRTGYAYFATDTYPFFPRCFRGTVSRDFLGRR